MAFTAKVALDTNMLLAINELKVDVFREINESLGKVEFVVPTQVMAELSKLEKTSKKLQRNVLIAKKLIQKNKVKKVIVEAKNADAALIKLSKKAIVASNDKELKKAVEKKNGHIIFLRKKKFIEVY